jgi:hypothetical protein
MFCDTSSHWSYRNSKQKIENIPGRNTRQAFQRFIAKTAILGTSHILRKVLQSEVWSLSGELHHWFKERNYWEKPVLRDKK